MQKTLNLVGLGGVGGHIAGSLLPTLRPLVASDHWWTINLVDADRYTAGNVRRQIGAEPGEKKVTAWRRQLESELEQCPLNAGGISVEELPFNLTQASAASLISEGDVTMLAVDNHPARRVACQWVAQLANGTLISGSNNQLTAGSVLLYARMKGKNITTPYTAYHREIREAGQLTLPRAGGCNEAEAPPQRAYTNGLVAHTVLAVLHQVLTETDPAKWPDEVRLDAGSYAMRPVIHRPH